MKTVEIVYRYDADETPASARPESAAQARSRLESGNVAFAELIDQLDPHAVGFAQQVVHVDPRELGVRTGGDAPIQRPFAAVLGCADARVPIELVFHEGPNDLFVVRIAGNVLGSDVLGSLRYAIENLADSIRLVVVLGHTGCGAVASAVDTFLSPGGYLGLATRHDLRGIVDGLMVAVLGADALLSAVHGADVSRAPGYRGALIELGVLVNAAIGAHTIQKEIEARGHAGRVSTAFGVYDLATRRVWAPTQSDGMRTGLGDAPADLDALRAIGVAFAGCERIRQRLAS